VRTRGEDPVRRGACARRGTCSPARRIGQAAASVHSVATAAAHTMSKKNNSFIMFYAIEMFTTVVSTCIH